MPIACYFSSIKIIHAVCTMPELAEVKVPFICLAHAGCLASQGCTLVLLLVEHNEQTLLILCSCTDRLEDLDSGVRHSNVSHLH